jgi:heme/copper-type cytochrome/quinol oxidase subunit 3
MQYVNRKKSLSKAEITQRDSEREQYEAQRRLRNNRLGIMIFQFSWIMVFVCLVIVYWQMGYQPGWRPTAEQAPHALLPTLATIALILSGWFAHRALKTVEATDPHYQTGQQPPFFRDWLIAIGLGAFFLVVMMTQFFAVPGGAAEGEQFGLIYRVMIGYHAVHAIVILLMMVQVWRFGADWRYHQANYWSVEAAAKLWYFVVVAWLLFYAVLYLPFLV